MDDRERRTVTSFENQTAHVKQKQYDEQSGHIRRASQALEETTATLRQLDGGISDYRNKARRGENVLLWRLALLARLRHLKWSAFAYVDVKLEVPHSEAKSSLLIERARECERAMRPHHAALTANGVAADEMETLLWTANQLALWTTEKSSERVFLDGLTAQEQASMARGRKLARVLNAAVRSVVHTNRAALAEWDDARRIPKSPGTTRAVGGHLKGQRKKPVRHPEGSAVPFQAPPDGPQPLPKRAATLWEMPLEEMLDTLGKTNPGAAKLLRASVPEALSHLEKTNPAAAERLRASVPEALLRHGVETPKPRRARARRKG